MAKKQQPLTWSAFCSEYAKKNGCTYKQALSQARDDYYKQLGKPIPEKKAKKVKKEKEVDVDELQIPVEPKKKGKGKKNVDVE